MNGVVPLVGASQVSAGVAPTPVAALAGDVSDAAPGAVHVGPMLSERVAELVVLHSLEACTNHEMLLFMFAEQEVPVVWQSCAPNGDDRTV